MALDEGIKVQSLYSENYKKMKFESQFREAEKSLICVGCVICLQLQDGKQEAMMVLL